ncbi:MAG: TAXI family TRAP transporter solute-binding subunit [Nocardioidaceae bacterium]
MKLAVPRARMPEAALTAVVTDVLRSAGQEVDAFDAAGGEARDIAAVHEGMADLGVGVADWVSWAYRARAAYEGWRHTSLRALVDVWQPQWLGIAVEAQSSVRTLREAGEQRSAVRLVTHPKSGYSAGWSHLVEEVFRGHGFELRDVAGDGGQIVDGASFDWQPAEDDGFDLLALAYGPQLGAVGTTWAQAGAHADLRFLVVDDEVMTAVAERHGLRTRPLPTGGLVEVPTGARSLYLPRFCVYASERLQDAEAQAIVGTLHDHRDQLLAAGFFLDPLRAFSTDGGLRLHRGALAYSREMGLAT